MNLRRDRLRRLRVIRFEELTENSECFVNLPAPALEAELGARQELALVEAVLQLLPSRCQQIFRLKRMEGLSQKEIARRLNVTETIVENDVRKAVKALQAALRDGREREESRTDREVAEGRAGYE